MVKYVKANACLVEAIFKGFDETRGAKNVLCRHDKFKDHLELGTPTYVGSFDTLFNYLVAWWVVHGGFDATWGICYSLCGSVAQPRGFQEFPKNLLISKILNLYY